MPNRILREGILTSRRVNRLKPQAEVFYRRLMSVVDDYGRYSADPALLRSSCYPRRLDEVREADISRWLAEVQTAGLIALYAVEEEPYLELLDFRQQVRAKASKFPAPPASATHASSTCIADAEHVRPESETESETRGECGGGARGAPRARSAPPTEAEWVAYCRATWPDWLEHDVLSAYGHYEKLEWHGVKNWKGCARTCYHRQAGAREVKRAPALVGAHRPMKGRVLRQVTQESPLWVVAVARALAHPARPVVPDELAAAWDRWVNGRVPEDHEPPDGWRTALEEAIAEAVEADERLTAAGGGRR